ncbi:MAG: hypothetical protein ABIK68_19920 [bacterium]
MKKLFLLLLTGLITHVGSAQVVTPLLDRAFPVEMASAAGWRFGSALGGQTAFASLEGETENVDTYNVDSSVLFSYQPSNIIAEFYWASPGTQYDWDYTSGSLYKNNNADGRFSLTLRGDNNVTLGIGYRIADQDTTSDTIKKSLYEGSFSLRMLDGLYLAAGMQRVTEKFASGDSRKWNRMLAGAAIQIGDPLKRMFRTEASFQTSPETTADNPAIQPHRKTSRVQASAELLFDRFLFSYQYQNTTLGAIELETEDQTVIKHRYGIGIKLGSALLGFYAGQGTQTAGEKELKMTSFQGTLSFGFI